MFNLSTSAFAGGVSGKRLLDKELDMQIKDLESPDPNSMWQKYQRAGVQASINNMGRDVRIEELKRQRQMLQGSAFAGGFAANPGQRKSSRMGY